MWHRSGPRLLAIALGVACGIAEALPSTARAQTLSDLEVVAPAMECGQLLFTDLSQLPEAPTRITSAEMVEEGGAAAPYCKVVGYVAPQVGFELHLPSTTWTQRLVFTGCGGLCGWIRPEVQQAHGCEPVENRTVALVASNLGHVGWNPGDGIWANGDPGAVVDFGYRGVHVVTVASKAIIETYYGQAPTYSYFVGCSDGGREALMEAQRFPEDFDGIVAGAPALNVSVLNVFHHVWNVAANTSADGRTILLSDRILLLHAGVLAACDGLDGLEDEIIDDPRACAFDPTSLVCAEGQDSADCLTRAEAETVARIYAGPTNAEGRRVTVGSVLPGSEVEWPGVITADDPNMPPFNRLIATGFVGNIAWWDGDAAKPLSEIAFDATTLESLEPVMSVVEARDPNLRPFAEAGGKLILWHGWADPHFPATNTLAYRAAVLEAMGEEMADGFLRTFIIPGMGHCGGGVGPNEMDVVTAIMAWVEGGQAPESLTVRRVEDGTITASRPVFAYPLVSAWDGTGDPDAAESYAAAEPQSPEPTYDWLAKAGYTSDSARWCEQEGLSLVCTPR